MISNTDQMLQSMKYDCNPKEHLKFLDALHIHVAALPFTYGNLNKKAPIPLIGICYMGEYLAEIPQLSATTWKWSMKQRIAATESVRGEKLDDGVKHMLLELKRILGKDALAWLAAQNAVKDSIFKLLSPDLPEIAEIQSHDLFGASRLLWLLCNKFRAEVALMGPQLNREIFATIESFTEICKDSSGVTILFNKIRLLLKTGQAAKGCMSSEIVIVNYIKSQMFKDDRLRQLSIFLQGKDVTLQELEFQIKNNVSRLPFDGATSSAKLHSVESVPSQSFYAESSHPRSDQRMQHAFFGAQFAQHEKSEKSDTRKRSFGRGQPPQASSSQVRLLNRLPREQWMKMSKSQRQKWINLQKQIMHLGKEVGKTRKDSSPTFPKRDDRVEQVDFAAESDDLGAFGSNVFFAGHSDVENINSQLEETSLLDFQVAFVDSSEAVPVEKMPSQLEQTSHLLVSSEAVPVNIFTSEPEETSHLDSQEAFVVSCLEDQQEFVFIPLDGGASSHVWKNPSMFIAIRSCKTPINTAKEDEVI